MKTIVAGLAACLIISVSMTACVNAQDPLNAVAGNFQLKDLSGKTYELSAYRDRQPVLLFFWTTWCPFCLQSLQTLNRDYVDIEKGGIALFGINAGERRRSVERLVRNYNIKYNILLDEESTATDLYRVVGVPTYVLIDKNGLIRYKGNSYPASEIKGIIGQK
jgi:peroxiredoxin